jgi:hypothetical protein
MLSSRLHAAPDALHSASAELRLVAACLRWPYSEEERLEAIAEAALQVGDWDRLLRIVTRHRVTGLVYRGLEQAGVGHSAALEQTAAAQTRQTLSFAFESVRLERMFREAGVELLFLKGVALTKLAYGDLSLRHAKDIDLLVEPEDNDRASELLERAGYRPRYVRAHMSPAQYGLWMRHSKGMEWMHPQTGVELELHWRLTDMPTLLWDGLGPGRQVVAVGVGELPTLDSERLMAYLCVHGASHGWSRLKWLADVFALLPEDPAGAERLYRRMLELGAGRAAGQALLLCKDLLGLELAPGLRLELENDWALRTLRRAALRTILRGGSEREIYGMAFGTTFVYLSRFLLGEGWQFLVSEARQRVYPPDRVASSHLHRRLIFLFPVLRAVDWITDRMRHRGRSEG